MLYTAVKSFQINLAVCVCARVAWCLGVRACSSLKDNFMNESLFVFLDASCDFIFCVYVCSLKLTSEFIYLGTLPLLCSGALFFFTLKLWIK